jgi:hypothetical protein
MLNYRFAMPIHSSTLLMALLSLFWIRSVAFAAPGQQEPTLTPSPTPLFIFVSPMNGQVLLGSIPIQIQANLETITAFELSFGYANDPTHTWFLIHQDSNLVVEQPLARWDTTTLTDGNYDLRLLVKLSNGQLIDSRVNGLRVRNYTPIETNTPTPITPTATPESGELPTATLTPTVTITLTPTLLPTNPAELTQTQITTSLGRGVLTVSVILLILGVFIGLRRAQLNKLQK